MSERNQAAPHECPECGEPSYLGFGVPGKCVARGCAFYDVGLWCEWVMLLPDDGIPKDSEPDYYDIGDEDTPTYGITFAGIPVTGRPSATFNYPPTDPALALWGLLYGVPRNPYEDDDNYLHRILDAMRKP